jgi:hypothetical protein
VTHLVGIVGDFNPDNHTHQATNVGLAHCGAPLEQPHPLLAGFAAAVGRAARGSAARAR